MRLAILSRRASIYTTRRLLQAARLRGAKVRVLDPLRIEMQLEGSSSKAFYQGKPLHGLDVVIPRIAPSIQAYGLAVVNQFAMMGVATLNDANGIATSRNKMRALQVLARAGIPVPQTVMAANAKDLRDMVALVGGVPVLVKLLTPSERPGVMVCESLQSMEAALEAVLSMGHNLLVQRYVRRKRERDLRALVVGGKVVAWVARRARPGRIFLTLAHGAELSAVRVGPELDALAVQAAAVVGLDVAAVDLLDAGSGPMVFDVYSSPGIKDLEKATGQDLALPIIARAEELANRSGQLQGPRRQASQSKSPPARKGQAAKKAGRP